LRNSPNAIRSKAFFWWRDLRANFNVHKTKGGLDVDFNLPDYDVFLQAGKERFSLRYRQCHRIAEIIETVSLLIFPPYSVQPKHCQLFIAGVWPGVLPRGNLGE
jgi:hypothetical protein